MFFSFFKKISFLLVLNLMVSPIFFLQSKLVFARTDQDGEADRPASLGDRFASIFSARNAQAGISSAFNGLSVRVYCGLSGLFLKSCDLNGTESVVRDTQATQFPPQNPATVITKETEGQDNVTVETRTQETVIERIVERVTSPVQILGVTTEFVENRIAQLAAELRSEMTDRTVTVRTSGSSGESFSSRQIDSIYENIGENINEAIEDLDTLSEDEIGALIAANDSSLPIGTAGYVLQATATSSQWVATSTLGFIGVTDLNALNPIEIGNSNVANGTSASAIGYSNTASNYYTSAFGYMNEASGFYSSSFGYSNIASGNSSAASGYDNTASAHYSSGLGVSNLASGLYSLASGFGNVATGTDSTAIGSRNEARTINSVLAGTRNFTGSSGLSSVVIGILNNSTGATLNATTGVITGTASAVATVGRLSTAVGVQNVSSGNQSVSVGYSNSASGYRAIALGQSNIASASYSSAFGFGNTASFGDSSAFGRSNNASGFGSSAFGRSNTASGPNTSAFGYTNTASGNYSSAFGYSNSAASNATAVGRSNSATGTSASAFGFSNIASGTQSTAVGSNINNSISQSVEIGAADTEKLQISASGVNFVTAGSGTFTVNGTPLGGVNALSSIEVGNSNTAAGSYSSAVGYTNSASGYYSSAVGYSNTAAGLNSSAFGYSNTASGYYSSALGHFNSSATSHSSAFGYSNSAAGIGSSAFGYSNSASGYYYTSAVGYSNTASGLNSSAFGYSNTASGVHSTAVGYSSVASGSASSAFGYTNTASGYYSSAVGYNNTASGVNSSVFGSGINNSVDNSVQIGPSDSAKVTIDTDGNLGVGTTTPSQKLSVEGSAQFTSVASGAFGSDLNLTAEGILTTSASDRRLKKNIALIDPKETLEKLMLLSPSTFDWESNGSRDLGLIAQEVEEIFPELVFTNRTDGYKGVNYSRLSSLLVAGVQEISNAMGEWVDYVEDGVAYLNEIVVKRFTAKQITVQNEDLYKTGVTIYDQKTGEPVCMFVYNGDIKTEHGACEDREERHEQDKNMPAQQNDENDSYDNTGEPSDGSSEVLAEEVLVPIESEEKGEDTGNLVPEAVQNYEPEATGENTGAEDAVIGESTVVDDPTKVTESEPETENQSVDASSSSEPVSESPAAI